MNIFFKFGSIKGSATESKHKDWCTAHSVGFGNHRAVKSTIGSSKNREMSAPVMRDIAITRNCDEASPKFWLESLTGKGETCEIHVARSGDGMDSFIELTLHDAIITSYDVALEGGASVEHITLSYVKMQNRYIPRTADNKAGSPLTTSFDASTSKKT